MGEGRVELWGGGVCCASGVHGKSGWEGVFHFEGFLFLGRGEGLIREWDRLLQIRPPQPPVYVFVIDVSQHAVQSG